MDLGRQWQHFVVWFDAVVRDLSRAKGAVGRFGVTQHAGTLPPRHTLLQLPTDCSTVVVLCIYEVCIYVSTGV